MVVWGGIYLDGEGAVKAEPCVGGDGGERPGSLKEDGQPRSGAAAP